MNRLGIRLVRLALGTMPVLTYAPCEAGLNEPIINQPADYLPWGSWSVIVKDEISAGKPAAPDLASGQVAIEPGSGLLSAPFPVTPFQYYRIHFEAQAEGNPLIRVLYTNASGKMLSDHSTGIDRSESPQAQTTFSRAKFNSSHARILIQAGKSPILLHSLQVYSASKKEVISWAEDITSTLPKLPDSLSPLKPSLFLDSVRKALRNSKQLRVVLLGDSIMNDTGNSPLDVLISRHYPGLDFQVVSSVENAKGAWFYRSEGRVPDYVISKDPDLVLIGGISHQNDLDALTEVIDQIQAQSDCAILLLSGAVGPTGDPRLWQDPPQGEIPPPTKWANQVRELADKKGVGFFDLEQAWGATIMNGPYPYEHYLRDHIHANTRGQIVLARIMEQFLSDRASP